MRHSLFLLLGAWLACLVNTLTWEGATHTPTPLITSTSVPKTTEPATLAKRDAVLPQTCGYINGNQSLAATCSVASSCVWHTDYYIVGCCRMTATKSPCLFYTDCVDERTDKTRVDDPLVYTCKGTSTCFQNAYDNGYRQWGCGYNAATVHLKYSGQSPQDATIRQVFTGIKELEAAPILTISATNPIPTSTVTATPSKGSGVSAGATAGIVIGGCVAGIILGYLFALCLSKRKKKGASVDGSEHQPMEYAHNDPSQSVPVSPQTQLSMPSSPYTYPGHASMGNGFPQPYPQSLSPEMHNPPREMDASPSFVQKK
ncbi:hypothetical protein HYFRA_00007714 [Hymenoscyphus fraxineus]|uniref:Mid2 domain-containing protein n=1 Tax=Hymenoscyphus fraxineus TaxID=746836 RepID=A0A9N9KKP3_9HELO|nr:hypothetical protein HYFRA_00007714 [Hymenoscyphus fraxineus]